MIQLPDDKNALVDGAYYWTNNWFGSSDRLRIVSAHRHRDEMWVITDGNQHRDVYLHDTKLSDITDVVLHGPIEIPEELK